ncbi:hypothetical protein V2J09_017193 [Rumex salicifolius]
MENSILLIVFLFCLSLLILKLISSTQNSNNLKKLPPGPKQLPILGNILQLTDKPHHALADLSRVHGPLMTLKLGQVSTVVVSSADMAREVFVKHDLAFSSRKVSNAVRALNHNLHSMAWLPVSPKWRDLRKLAVTQLFSVKCLNQSQPLRHKKVSEMLEYVDECCRNGSSVDIGSVGFTTSLNLLSNTFFSQDMAAYSSVSSHELRDVVWSIMEYVGKPNLADFFPVLAYFDPLRIKRDLITNFSKMFVVFDDVIKQRKLLIDGADSRAKGDVLDTLLRINEEQDGSHLSLDDIKHLLLSTSAEEQLSDRYPSLKVKAPALQLFMPPRNLVPKNKGLFLGPDDDVVKTGAAKLGGVYAPERVVQGAREQLGLPGDAGSRLKG